MERLPITAAVLTTVLLVASACSAAPRRAAQGVPPAAAASAAAHPAAAQADRSSDTARASIPCDPGAGLPQQRPGCPDTEPETGWLTERDGRLSLAPFRTLHNGPAGEAYARAHGTEYPFPNDYLDVAAGEGGLLELAPATVCTGIILVGYRELLDDHPVPCEALVGVAEQRRVPIAVWRAGGEVVQASELYRP